MKMNPHWRPSFFKIIPPNHTHDQLRIPPYLKKNVSMEMFDTVVLRDSCGDHWPVKLQKRSEDIYLGDGWPQFARDHALGDYEFLVFKYDGDMCFNVQIFEKSGCERVHASTHMKLLDSPVPPSIKGKRGKPRKAQPSSLHFSPKSLEFVPDGTGQELKLPSNRGRHPPPEIPMEALKMAKTFSSKHPHFLVCVTVRNMRNYLLQHIPISFSQLHFPRSKATFILRNSKGKTWEVVANYQGKYHTFAAGWASFLQSNNVTDGDVCLFELVGKKMLQVHVFPARAE